MRFLRILALAAVFGAHPAFGNGRLGIPAGEVVPPTLTPAVSGAAGAVPPAAPGESGSSISTLESSLALPDSPDVLQAPPEALLHQPPTAAVEEKKAEPEWVQAAQDLGTELGVHQETLARPDLTAPQAHSTGRKVEGLMAQVLRTLAKEPEGAQLDLDFVPTPQDLKAIANMGRDSDVRNAFEVFLFRTRRGPWRIAKGNLHGVGGEFEDYDLALHNHADLRLGAYRLYSPYPGPYDFIASAGKAARFFVISLDGLVEWSARIPFPDDPDRPLPANSSEEESREWIRQMTDGTLFRKIVMRVLFPQYLYPTLLKSIGIAAVRKPWRKVTQEWLLRGGPPMTEDHLVRELLPRILRDELSQVGLRMAGRPLEPAEMERVLAETSVKPIRWYHWFTDGVATDPAGATALAGVPDGITYPDGSIRLNLKRPWRGYRSVEEHFRVLFTHEYTHRLQTEGKLSRRYGGEIPAVAFEVLRAIERIGLRSAAAGELAFLHKGVMEMFEAGRRWARGDRRSYDGFYHKGYLAGAAYELSLMTGRPEDAWEYVRKLSRPDMTENPGELFEAVVRKTP